MRTLERRLRLPPVAEQLKDETSYAIFLPRRSTRWLYRIFALAIGAAVGVGYARFILEDATVLWTVALAALGAVLGYVLVLMPAAVLYRMRGFALSTIVRRRAAALRNRFERLLGRAEKEVVENEDDVDALKRLGIAALMVGERQRAVAAFERACSINGDPACPINLSAALAESTELSAAADLLLEATDRDGASSAAHHNLGVLLARRPPQPVVERVIERLDRLRSPVVLSNLGAWELTHGALDLAERYFEAAIEQDGTSVAARANLGLVEFRRNRLKAAISRLHDAAHLDPLNGALVNDLGAVLCANGRPMQAARALSRAAALLPGNPAVELNRGVVRLVLGQYGDSLESLTDPNVRNVYPVLAAHNAALALIGLNRAQAAREQIEWGLEHDEEDAGLRNNLGCLAWLEGDEAGMLREMSRLKEAADLGATVNIAAAWIATGRTEDALELLSGLDRTADPAVSFYRGVALLADAVKLYSPNMNKTQRQRFFESLHRCLAPLNAAASSETAGIEARVNLALYHYFRLDYTAAADGFQAAAAEFPQDGFLQFATGTALAEEARKVQSEHEATNGGDQLVGRARELLRRARKHLEMAAELGEVTADVFCNLGMCAYDLGDIEGALVAFKRMIQLEDSADSANNLAIVYAREGQRLHHAARAAGLASQDREKDMLLKAQTHLSSALHYFMKALEHARDDATLHGNIGLAHMMRNRGDDVDAALRHWQRMLVLGGKTASKRYQELTAFAQEEKGGRAEFDETLMEFRPLDPRRSLVMMPPRLSGARYALLPITEEMEWQLVSDDPQVRELLRQRERLSGLRKRLARLSL